MGVTGLTSTGLVLSTRNLHDVYAATFSVFSVDSDGDPFLIKPIVFLFDRPSGLIKDEIVRTELKFISRWDYVRRIQGGLNKKTWEEALGYLQEQANKTIRRFAGFHMSGFVTQALKRYGISVEYLDLSLIHVCKYHLGEIPWVKTQDDLYSYVDWGIKGYRVVDLVHFWCKNKISQLNALAGFTPSSDISICRWSPVWRAFAIGFVYREMYKELCSRPVEYNYLYKFAFGMPIRKGAIT